MTTWQIVVFAVGFVALFVSGLCAAYWTGRRDEARAFLKRWNEKFPED